MSDENKKVRSSRLSAGGLRDRRTMALKLVLLAVALALVQAAAALSGSTTPGCGLHFMDMPFSGEDGLVTDKNQAILVVSCSEAVETTAVQQLDKCLQVVGPADSSVRTIGVGESAQKFHQLAMSWEATYAGHVSVELICDLASIAGNVMRQAVPAVTFNVLAKPAAQTNHRILAEAPAPR